MCQMTVHVLRLFLEYLVVFYEYVSSWFPEKSYFTNFKNLKKNHEFLWILKDRANFIFCLFTYFIYYLFTVLSFDTSVYCIFYKVQTETSVISLSSFRN